MPTYEYVCEKCNHVFELSQPITAAPLTVCPKEHCGQRRWGKGAVKRAISGGAGLLFKGSGFYITDYRSESYKAAAKKEQASSAPSAAGGDGKPAAKPDAKPATTSSGSS
jgi:putative FmdB family regulatory protein